MTQWRRVGMIVGAAIAVGGASLAMPSEARARPRGSFHRPLVVVRGFYGPSFGLGYGWGGPYWGPYVAPYYWRPEGGIDINAAFVAGYGAVDVSVKPNQAEVWADGKFVAEARDLDGYPSYLWLKEGPHHLVVYKGGYRSFEEDINVERGVARELKVHLEKGESEAPGRRPAEIQPVR